jgi:hypothetical protein
MLADSYSNLVHHIWPQIVVVHHKLLHGWVVSKQVDQSLDGLRSDVIS